MKFNESKFTLFLFWSLLVFFSFMIITANVVIEAEGVITNDLLWESDPSQVGRRLLRTGLVKQVKLSSCGGDQQGVLETLNSPVHLPHRPPPRPPPSPLPPPPPPAPAGSSQMPRGYWNSGEHHCTGDLVQINLVLPSNCNRVSPPQSLPMSKPPSPLIPEVS